MKPLLLSLLLLPAVAFANPSKMAEDYCNTFKDISVKAYDTNEAPGENRQRRISNIEISKL